MRRTVFLIFAAVVMTTAHLFAEPDARDSIIIESKTVSPGAHPGDAKDTAAYLYLKIFITNKDSLTALSLAMEERSTSGGAYAVLGRPRTSRGVLNLLTGTLHGSVVANCPNYDSKSPDSMIFAGIYDPLDPVTIEPPNKTRKAIWEIKFDSVLANPGTIEFRGVNYIQPPGFVDRGPRDIRVNFLPGVVTVKGKTKK